MSDHLTTIRPTDSAHLRDLRLRLAVLRMGALRIEERAERRRAARPAPTSRAEFERFRRRDYDAAKRARLARAQAARVVAEITRADELAAAIAAII